MDFRLLLAGVCCLGLLGFTAILGIIVIADAGREIPPALAAIAGSCIAPIPALAVMAMRAKPNGPASP